MNRRQIVGPHQPDETRARPSRGQPCQGRRGLRRAEPVLKIDDPDSGVAGRMPGGSHPVGERRHAGLWLQGILRRDHPPDLIQAESLQRLAGDVQMSVMGRVEGPAQQTNSEGSARSEA